MSIKAKIASKYIPSYEKNKKYFQLLVEYLIATYDSLKEEYGADKTKLLLSTISARTGIQVAQILKNELALEESYESAVVSWKIGCTLLGFTIHTINHKEGILFYHDTDPLWQCFRKKNLDLCECMCVPMVNAVAQEFYRHCSTHFEHPPSLQSPCIKLLKRT